MSIPETMPTEKEEESAPVENGEEAEDMEGEDTNEDSKKEGDEPKEGEGEKKPKIDPKDWPLKDIKEPTDNDVLFGRGGVYFFVCLDGGTIMVALHRHRSFVCTNMFFFFAHQQLHSIQFNSITTIVPGGTNHAKGKLRRRIQVNKRPLLWRNQLF
jgi:hypothetical protein